MTPPAYSPFGGHDVEGRGRPEVDHDAGPAQPLERRHGIHDAVGADLLGHVVENRHSRLDSRLDEERFPFEDLSKSLAQRET